MSVLVNTKLDFGNARRVTNLAAAAANGEAVVFEQLNAALEGLAWKDNCRASAASDTNLAAPGASVDGITMSVNDRVLLRGQTLVPNNGIYVWNGAAVPMTRAADADTFEKLESATVTVDEGTAGGATFRQTQVNGAIGTNDIVWAAFGGAAAATESTAGIAEIATQSETNTGTDDQRFVTPLKLATWSGAPKRYAASIGDGAATSYGVTHNLGTLDVQVYCYENSGTKREVFVEKQHTSINQVTLVFDSAPALNSIRIVVVA